MAKNGSQHTQGFAAVLYTVFNIEKAFRVDEIAPKLDLAPSTLYEYVRGFSTFPPDLIAPLYCATRDRRFLSFFLDPCRVVFFDGPDADRTIPAQVMEQMLNAQEEFLHVMRGAVQALADGKITREEVEEIRQEMWHCFSETAKLVDALERARMKGVVQ